MKTLAAPMLLKKRSARASNLDKGVSVHTCSRDEPAFVRFFPGWKFRTRCSPCFYHVIISAIREYDVFQEVEDQVVDGLRHGRIRLVSSGRYQRLLAQF